MALTDDLVSQRRDDGTGTNTDTTSTYLYDGLGSTRLLIDEAGAVTDTYLYEAFGEILEQTGTTENDYLYTGEQYDANAGFYYLRARYYNPGQGRFLSMDIFPGSPFSEISLHKYLYASANPSNSADPSGYFDLRQATLTVNTLVARAVSSGVVGLHVTRSASFRLLIRIRRFFYDPRSFAKISREYWKKHGPAKGASLHHWLFGQRAKNIPVGIRNAGFNLLKLPQVINFPGGLNSWMGFAARWGGRHKFKALLVENGIRIGIVSAALGGPYAAYHFMTFALDRGEQETREP